MDRDNTVKRQINPREKANFLSLVTFFYTRYIYIKGYKQGLELHDVYDIRPESDTKRVSEELTQRWERDKKENKSPSICRAVWSCYGKSWILIGLVQFISTMIITTVSPKALSKLVSYFNPNETNVTEKTAYFYASLVIGINLIHPIVTYNVRVILQRMSLDAKAALSGLLYRKSLKIKSETLSDVTVGRIVTIITKDTELETLFTAGNNAWIAVIQTILVCYLISGQIGIASLAGIAFFLVVLPLQVFIGSLTYRYKLECSKKTDERVDLVREILSACKIIKMYTWEKFFENKIHSSRKGELRKLHHLFYTKVWIKTIGSISSKTSFFLFLMVYIWTGNNVTAEIVYYILSCCGNLEDSLGNDVPSGFAQFAQFFAMGKRVEDVLNSPELPSKQILQTNQAISFKNVDVLIKNSAILENITINLKSGLNTVVGHIGSGKTTFLKGILQEWKTTGETRITGKISYASQEPWLFPSTIRNNILFGEDFNEKRYQKVLKICSLEYDINLFPEGDNTIVGESGVNMSKGQQARINLARAVYKESDIYLLDDCLASLDANVSDAIFQECICKFLKNKTRIFVTNNPDHIQKGDKIIKISSKCVRHIENVEKLKVQIIDETVNEETDNKTEERPVKEIYHETKNSRVVPFKAFIRYIQHGGGFILFILIVVLYVIAQSATNYGDKLMSTWITLEQNLTNLKILNETDSWEYYELYEERTYELIWYTTVVAISIFLSLITYFAAFFFIRMASLRIHRTMAHSIINSTMKFFDTYFIGNVINRFTKDCFNLDDTLAFVIMDCVAIIFVACGGVVLLASVNYIFLIESCLFLTATIIVKQLCQPTGRSIERLHVIARSPIAGHVNSTLEGLTTIRASNAQDIVTKEFDRHQNVFTSALFMAIINFNALSVFVKFLGTIFTSCVIFQFLVADLRSSVGDVGLAITQAFTISNIITYGIISFADCENLMISLERILEFTELEEEDKKGKILPDWPKFGSISFSNISLTYGNTEILNSVNFDIKHKEKLGVVGRTGAGKSSIITSLFRMYPTKGKITIDGIDINELSLPWYRSKISVIPQDPYLFPVTLRENLDPLQNYNDDQIWKVIKELRLDHLIDNLNIRIDKGATFSSGQKQLLCLARAILRHSKIVILDEATANVDEETDDLIQEAIQKYFGESTLIIIAHKLQLVLKCDKVLVMSEGRVSEFGEPVRLLENENSFLNSVIR